jgi:hypothetical protein
LHWLVEVHDMQVVSPDDPDEPEEPVEPEDPEVPPHWQMPVFALSQGLPPQSAGEVQRLAESQKPAVALQMLEPSSQHPVAQSDP